MRMTTIKETDHSKHYDDVEQLELSHAAKAFRNDGALINQILPNPIRRITA